jgi:hypothetical protein
MARREPDQLEIVNAWDRLRRAIERVETSQPFQMSANIVSLREERTAFEDLIMGRPSRKDQAG